MAGGVEPLTLMLVLMMLTLMAGSFVQRRR